MTEPARSRRVSLRWGIPDAAIAWLVGLAVGLTALAPFVDAKGRVPLRLQVEGTLTALAAQSVGIVAALVVIARRKGRGSLRDDFGLAVRGEHVRELLLWMGVGVGVGLLVQGILVPIAELGDIHETQQEVAKALQHTTDWLETTVFLIGTVVVAPITEELLFRGVLLRGLARRMSGGWAVFVSATAFALVHPLGDVDTAYAIPAFFLLGLVSGQRALATGRLTQSIALHAGFNLLGSILLLTDLA